MKKFYKLLGIIVIGAVIGFSLAGCKNGTTDDGGGGGGGGGGLNLTGTWKHSSNVTLIFATESYGGQTIYTLEILDEQGRQRSAGSCDINGNTVSTGSNSFKTAVSGNTLTVSESANPTGVPNGDYTKQ